MYCIVCGADLPKSNPSLGMAKPKLAVFHVEETVLDNSAGERIAKRKGLSGKRFGREVAANLEKAVSRIGVKDYINRLARDNYTIAFISSLDSSYQYRLQDRLRHLGFPIMTDTTGPLVLMGSSQDNIRSLARRYDITFAFGTSPAGTAKQMNVPGVYATVEDYIGDSKNPYIAPTETPAPYTLSGLRPEPTPAPYTLANPHEAGHFTPLDWIERDNWDELQPAWMEKIDYEGTQGEVGNKSGIKDMTIFEIEDALRMMEHDMKAITEKMESERKQAQGKGHYAWEIYEAYKGYQEDQSENIEALVSELRRRKGGHMANPLSNAPFDIKDAANMTEAERQAALREYQDKQFALKQAEQARIDAAEAKEAARKARLAANIPTLRSSVKGWAEKYLDPQLPQIIAEMKKPPTFTAYAPIGAGGDGFRGAALAILKDIHRNSRDAGFDMYAYLSDLYGVNVSLSHYNKYGADQWKIRFDDNPAGFTPPLPRPPFPDMTNPPPKPRRQKRNTSSDSWATKR
jgi:hypothetical protein